MYISRAENGMVANIDRDYAACGLSTSGTSCGGSANTPIPHFDIQYLVTQHMMVLLSLMSKNFGQS